MRGLHRQPRGLGVPVRHHMCVCELCATGLSACPICRRRSRPIRVFAT